MAFLPTNNKYYKKRKEVKMTEMICVDCGEVNGGSKSRCQLCGGRTHNPEYDVREDDESERLIDRGEENEEDEEM